jgi:hypothetical protein
MANGLPNMFIVVSKGNIETEKEGNEGEKLREGDQHRTEGTDNILPFAWIRLGNIMPKGFRPRFRHTHNAEGEK